MKAFKVFIKPFEAPQVSENKNLSKNYLRPELGRKGLPKMHTVILVTSSILLDPP